MYNKNLSIIVLCLLIPTLLISACSPNRHQSATLEYFSSSNPTHSSVTAFEYSAIYQILIVHQQQLRNTHRSCACFSKGRILTRT
jgi:hypothetical protein